MKKIPKVNDKVFLLYPNKEGFASDTTFVMKDYGASVQYFEGVVKEVKIFEKSFHHRECLIEFTFKCEMTKNYTGREIVMGYTGLDPELTKLTSVDLPTGLYSCANFNYDVKDPGLNAFYSAGGFVYGIACFSTRTKMMKYVKNCLKRDYQYKRGEYNIAKAKFKKFKGL